jgi:peptidoglycan hydrolase FlgJ
MHISAIGPAVGDGSPVQNSREASFRIPQARQEKSPLVQFEAFVLQDFVSAMLPADSENVYGKGLSGEMWRSMFAEKIAAQMAEHGGIGIADRLLKDFHIEGEARLPLQGVSDPAHALSEGEPDALAKAMMQELQTKKFGVSGTLDRQDMERGS